MVLRIEQRRESDSLTGIHVQVQENTLLRVTVVVLAMSGNDGIQDTTNRTQISCA